MENKGQNAFTDMMRTVHEMCNNIYVYVKAKEIATIGNLAGGYR